jgi:hypothetical protein
MGRGKKLRKEKSGKGKNGKRKNAGGENLEKTWKRQMKKIWKEKNFKWLRNFKRKTQIYGKKN